MLYQNTDTQIDALYTNYPFTHTSTRLVQGAQIPNTLFRSVHMCVQKAVSPLHITRISKYDPSIQVQIQDMQRTTTLYFQLLQGCQVSFILNENRVPCGILQCNSQLYSCIAPFVAAQPSVDVDIYSFVFLPQCVSVACTKGLHSISLNNNLLDQDKIQLKKNLVYQYDQHDQHDQYDQCVHFDMYSDDNEDGDKRLLYINGVFAGGKHIVIKSNTLSDLRVVTDSNIKLLGVADV